MGAYLRVAGTGLLADGSRLVWSVADGRLGRRWRAVASVDGAVTHGLLLEVDPDGRPSRLELTTAAGMLTLHPDGEGRVLHGNVVTADGVRHVRLPWSDAHGLEVDRRPIASAVTAHRLASLLAVGEGRNVPVLLITADLAITPATRRFDRVAEGDWRIASPSGEDAVTLRIDGHGVPAALHDTRAWPLELDEAMD